MKILIIQPWIKQGGAELISVHLAYELERQGHEAPIACTFLNKTGMPDQSNRVQYLLPSKLVSSILARNRFAFLIFGPWILLWIVWKHSQDVDILNPHNFPSSWIAALVGKLRNKPVIWTCNEPPYPIKLSESKNVGIANLIGWLFASSPIDRLLIRWVSLIHVLSRRTQLEVSKRYGKESVIIRSGVDINLFSRSSPENVIANYDLVDKFILLSVGKLHPQKNHIVAIEALKRILPSVPNAVLLFVGDGPMRRELEDFTKQARISDHVMFLGLVSSRELSALYKACDIHLFPAISQSWGLTPFEALCAGKISIVSTDTGAAEVLEEETIGIISDPTPEAFESYILDVYKNPNRYWEMVRRGNDYVKKCLNHQSFANKFLELITQGQISSKQDVREDTPCSEGTLQV
jgi:glycosyltransferase involved in cell wall biosynthesis